MTHREYVVSGRIRYLTDDGAEVVGEPGEFLFIAPGHRAWVVGDETCVLIDW
jgi:quercetin dioxygenase-like cupin family protein